MSNNKDNQVSDQANVSLREAAPAPSDLAKSVQTLEGRVSQLVQALDEQRKYNYRVIRAVGLVFCLALLGTAAYTVYAQMTARMTPPKLEQFVPVQIQVGDKTMLVGVGIVNWEVPPALNATFLQLEQRKRDAEEKARKEAEERKVKSSTASANATPAASTTK